MRRVSTAAFAGWFRSYLEKRGFTTSRKQLEEKILPLAASVAELEPLKVALIEAQKNLDPKRTGFVYCANIINAVNRDLGLYKADIKTWEEKKISRLSDAAIKKTYDMIMKNGHIVDVKIEDEYLKLFTDTLFLRDELTNRAVPDGKLGRFCIGINAKKTYGTESYLRIVNLDYHDARYQHLNVNEYGSLCSGDYSNDLKREDLKGKLVNFISLVVSILEFPGDVGGSPYIDRGAWAKHKTARKVDDGFSLKTWRETWTADREEDNDQ